MDWFLYDNGLRHKSVKTHGPFIKINFFFPTIYDQPMFGEKKIHPIGAVDRKGHGH